MISIKEFLYSRIKFVLYQSGWLSKEVQAIRAKLVENRPNKGFPLSFMGTFTCTYSTNYSSYSLVVRRAHQRSSPSSIIDALLSFSTQSAEEWPERKTKTTMTGAVGVSS
jgi:predicted neutral ceramidase superfamily lipid hydrolase